MVVEFWPQDCLVERHRGPAWHLARARGLSLRRNKVSSKIDFQRNAVVIHICLLSETAHAVCRPLHLDSFLVGLCGLCNTRGTECVSNCLDAVGECKGSLK